MKKFKFLAFLVIALIMFLSVNSQAQTMVEPIKGAQLVQTDMDDLIAKASPASMAAITPQSVVSNLRLAVGQELVPLLKQGTDVSSAISSSVSKFHSTSATQNAQLAEVELHYRNLLRKPF